MPFLTPPVVANNNIGRVCYDGTHFRAFRLVADVNSHAAEFYSTDGLNWTNAGAYPVASDTSLVSCSVSNGSGLVLAATGPSVYRSTAIGTWSLVTTLAAAGGVAGLAYSTGKWIAFSISSVRTSADGITWSAETTLPNTGGAGTSVVGVAYNGSRYIAVTQVGGLYSSTDGVTWVQQFPLVSMSYTVATQLLGVVYSSFHSKFLVSGGAYDATGMLLFTSTSGIAGWTSQAVPGVVVSTNPTSVTPSFMTPTVCSDAIYLAQGRLTGGLRVLRLNVDYTTTDSGGLDGVPFTGSPYPQPIRMARSAGLFVFDDIRATIPGSNVTQSFVVQYVVPSLAITPSTPPSAQIGAGYAHTFVATDGTLPYAWSATGLPTGLTIAASTGIVSGTPTVIGAFSATITVTDNAAGTASLTVGFTVGAGGGTGLPSGNGTVCGVVDPAGAYTVLLGDHSLKMILGITTSAGDGSYSFPNLDTSRDYFVVPLAAGTTLQKMIGLDHVTALE